jgi:hypothetical protein
MPAMAVTLTNTTVLQKACAKANKGLKDLHRCITTVTSHHVPLVHVHVTW